MKKLISFVFEQPKGITLMAMWGKIGVEKTDVSWQLHGNVFKHIETRHNTTMGFSTVVP